MEDWVAIVAAKKERVTLCNAIFYNLNSMTNSKQPLRARMANILPGSCEWTVGDQM